MSDVFKLLFNESIGDIRTHHTFIDGSKFLNTCYEAPIKEFLDGYVPVSYTHLTLPTNREV